MPRLQLWRVALVLCLLAVLCFWLSLHRAGPLWPGAVARPATSGLIITDFIPSGYDHVPRRASAWFWRSESELTCLQTSGSDTLEWIDVDLASDRVLRRFPGRLLRPHAPDSELFYWSASPDGRWLLQISRRGPDRIYATFSLDGTAHAAWTNRYESHTNPEWLSDSSGFVEWPIREGQLLARVHWVDSGTSIEVNLSQLPGHTNFHAEPFPQPFVRMTKWPLAPGVVTEFLVLDPIDNPAAWHRRVLRLPEALAEHAAVQVYAAPTGDRLAWLAHTRSLVPSVNTSRHFPHLEFQTRHRTTLLLSQPDGTDLSTIGRTPAGETIEHLQWTPEATRIGFLYAGQFWIQALPAP